MSPLERLVIASSLYGAVRVAPVLGVEVDDVIKLVAGLADPDTADAALERVRNLGDGFEMLVADDGTPVHVVGEEFSE